jgi:hypothetical protein
MEYSWEVRERAEELYVVDGCTYDQVAEATGVSVSQLKRWGAEGDWSGRRRQYRQDLAEIRRNMVTLRRELIRKALTSLDPQDIYAIGSLETVAARAAKQEEAPPPAEISMEIHTPADAVKALEQAVEAKLNAMLARPGVLNLGGIKDMKKALELIEELKAKHLPAEEKKAARELTPAMLKAIREQVYGLA